MTGELLCMIPGASHLYGTEPDDRPTRWCFACRAHLPHRWELWGDPPPPDWVMDALHDDGLDGYAVYELMGFFSYYDPEWRLRCPSGHSDTYFPGCGPL